MRIEDIDNMNEEEMEALIDAKLGELFDKTADVRTSSMDIFMSRNKFIEMVRAVLKKYQQIEKEEKEKKLNELKDMLFESMMEK
jgi:ribosomal protein L29